MMFLFDRHRRLRHQLSAYIDGALAPAAAGRLEAHLGECERCRTELDQLRATVAALQELPEAEVSRSFALSPERVAAPRPSLAATPLAFGARIAAAGVAAALAAVLVVDVGDLGGDGGTEEVLSPPTAAERQAGDVKANGEGAAGEEPAPTGMMYDEMTDEGGLAAEGDAAAGARAPEPEDASPLEPAAAPSPAPEDAGEDADGEFTLDSGAGETPAAERGEADAVAGVPPEDGGIDALTVAEIALAGALAVLVSGSLALAYAGRKR